MLLDLTLSIWQIGVSENCEKRREVQQKIILGGLVILVFGILAIAYWNDWAGVNEDRKKVDDHDDSDDAASPITQ